MHASVVIPAHNARGYLPDVLPPLSRLGPSVEVLLVDDGSTDGTAELAASLLPRLKVLATERCSGPAAARNLGARHALGEVLVFLDSDVVTRPETIEAMAALLHEHPQLDATFGCYNQDGARDEPALSRFRNLLHRYVHQLGAGEAVTFWAALGAVRRQAFLECGGFREDLFPYPCVEDIELGARLVKAGRRIRLEPAFQGRHLKRWTLRSMLFTDTFRRAAPWTRLILEGLAPGHALNLSGRFRLAPLLLGLTLVSPWKAWPLLAYVATNVPTYRYMADRNLGLQAVGYLALHHLACLAGAMVGVGQFLGSGKRSQARPRSRRHPCEAPPRTPRPGD